MKIRILGGGWYGCHLAVSLLDAGHDVELHEIAGRLFSGASGGNPARLHLGFHYPRSHVTRALCQEHYAMFMHRYGGLTRSVPVNIYAVAAEESTVDFGTYCQVLKGQVEYVTIPCPEEYGLENVEGALLTGERHIVIDEARRYFQLRLAGHYHVNVPKEEVESDGWDLTIDCTFCSNEGHGIDRYEPCITALLRGPTDKAVTIMDGPFPSVYPWDEHQGLSSLTSALLTPFSKTCKTWQEARTILDSLSVHDVEDRMEAMVAQMSRYWPSVRDIYKAVDQRLTIRAMPRSGADARLVDIVRIGKRALRIRAGKIDAILLAETAVKEMVCSL